MLGVQMALHPSHASWWSTAPQYVRDAILGKPVVFPLVGKPKWDGFVPESERIVCLITGSLEARGSRAIEVNEWGQIRGTDAWYSCYVICPRCQEEVAYSRHKPHPLRGTRGASAMFMCDTCWQTARERDGKAYDAYRERGERASAAEEARIAAWKRARKAVERVRGGKQCLAQMEYDEYKGRLEDIHMAALRCAPGFQPRRLAKTKYEERYSAKAIRHAATYILARASGASDPEALLAGLDRRIRKTAEGKATGSDRVDSRSQQTAD